MTQTRRSISLCILVAVLIGIAPMIGTSQVKDPPKAVALEGPAPGWVGDHCTWFPDGDYADCCDAHDRDYYRGGTKEERKASDKRLKQCVRAKGHKYIAKIMYFGTRIGGGAWLKAPFSWGFGQRKKKKKVD